MLAANAQPLGKVVVVTDNQSGVASGTKVFRRIKTETTGAANASSFGRSVLKRKFRANRLSCVLNQNQVLLTRNREHFIHVAAQTKKVGRH